ncbi:MAG: hypothetical protein U9P12_04760, partial [Verrucomicrobiota bacterium]|nr:hypothetical protein [Verrucomicrobiota bacterium]
MIKTHISSLLVVLLVGVQTVRAQDSLDDVFAQLDAAQGSEGQEVVAPAETAPAAPAPEPAAVETAQPATVESTTAAAPAPVAA